MLLFTALGPYQAPHISSQSQEYAAIYRTWGLSASPHVLPKSRLCCYLRYLGPIRLITEAPKVENMLLFTALAAYQPPHMCSQSRDHAVIYGTWAPSGSSQRLPKSRICCYLQHLQLISLPTCAPKVEIMLLFTGALSVSPHRLPKSRICCYLRHLGPISLPTYAPKVEIMLLFIMLGPYQAPQTGSQSREYAAIYGTWALSASPHVLPKSRLCCYLRYLGHIRLPT
jgi:hypothetical protein